MSELTDSLVAQAERDERPAREQSAGLARRRPSAQLAAADPAQSQALSSRRWPHAAEPSARGSHLSAVAPVAEPRALRPSRGAEERGSAAGARLLATQMAVSGTSREEIAARLRTGFEIEDTGAILDAILGPEGLEMHEDPTRMMRTASDDPTGGQRRTATCGCWSPA